MTESAPTSDTAQDVQQEELFGIPVHPAANVFPMLSDAQMQELADDISRNGLIEPIVLYQGQLLDGRNRLAACNLAGVEPKFIKLDADKVESPSAYVVSLNLHRRMLSASQRAAIALTLERMFADEARQRSLEGARRGGLATAARRRGAVVPEFSAAPTPGVSPQPPADVAPSPAPAAAPTPSSPPPPTPDSPPVPVTSPFGKSTTSTRSRDRAAAALGVSAGYVSQAKQIKDAAPEVLDEIVSGKVTIPEAKRRVFPSLEGIKPDKPKTPTPRTIRRPRRSGKVSSSRITLNLTVTFGSPEVAQKVLQGLDADPRVLNMEHETLDEPAGDTSGDAQ